MMLKTYKLLGLLAASALPLVACGGGGSDETQNGPANDAPNVVVTANSARVVESHQIDLSAEGSTDANGDSLTYQWTQIAGPTAISDENTSLARLSLQAPDVEGVTILTFEVAVSDAQDTTTRSLSITVEPLAFKNTGGVIFAMTPTAPNRFAVVTGGNGIGDFNYNIQTYASDGTPVGSPASGSLSVPSGKDTVGLNIEGITQSGDTVYNSFSSGDYSRPESIALTTLRGEMNQDFQSLGDEYANFSGASVILNYDAIPVGENQLGTIVVVPSSGAGREVAAHIINPDGSLEASASLTTTGFYAVNSVIANFDTNTFAGIWGEREKINLQAFDIEGDLVGSRIRFDPIGDGYLGHLSATSIANNRVMVLSAEGDNHAPAIVLRVINQSGVLEVPATQIGNGTESYALTLNDGNILVIWDGGNNGLLARIVTPSGEVASETAILSAERLVNVDPPIQLDDGTVVISYLESLLSFPIDAFGFFPTLPSQNTGQ